jgi:hypothetical protein
MISRVLLKLLQNVLALKREVFELIREDIDLPCQA